ncbi:MAG: TolC family protein [Opitutaceae bacterium]|jgi:outer membrane protein TolC
MRNTKNTKETESLRPAGSRLLQLTLVAGLALAAHGAKAGLLQDIYSGTLSADQGMTVTDLNAKAADQQVITEQRRYLPKVSINAHEGAVYQDVRKSGNPVFKSGTSTYGNTRVNAELDQPLYDPTIKPLVDAAKARRQQVLSRGRQTTEWQTRMVVEGFLRSVRYHALSQSADRVIARLEKEQETVTKSYEAKIATLSDVQNVGLALASMKRERNNFTQQFYHELSTMGVSSEKVKEGWVKMNPEANTAVLTDVVPDGKGQPAEIERLKAEAAEASNQGIAAKRRSWPVLSLYGEYGFDNAGGSSFGGPRDQSLYAAGVVVKWDIFSRGMNRSEAREFAYRKQAKEAELRAMSADRQKADVYSKEFLDQSNRSVAELADLMKQYEGLRDSSARAYEAGKDSYINAITAYLACESTARELTNAQYDRLVQQTLYCGQTAGWNGALVEKVDALFVASK